MNVLRRPIEPATNLKQTLTLKAKSSDAPSPIALQLIQSKASSLCRVADGGAA
jgi:hypothetical protein